jgi:hypothetical protein
MQLALIALFSAGLLAATDPDDWIAEAGGTVTLDSAGKIVSVDLRASWVSDSDVAALAALPYLTRLDLSPDAL